MKAKKVLLLGAQAVGKTSIARRLRFDTFQHDYKSTIGVQLHEVQFDVDNHRQSVVLWDTDGNFGDKVFDSVYIKGAHAALVVADCTRAHTINHMLDLVHGFEQKLPGRPCFAVLNKIDLDEPSPAVMESLQQQVAQLHLCSAYSGEGLLQATQCLLAASNRKDATW